MVSSGSFRRCQRKANMVRRHRAMGTNHLMANDYRSRRTGRHMGFVPNRKSAPIAITGIELAVVPRGGCTMNFLRHQFLKLAAVVAAATAVPQLASALDYPTRPVRIIAGFAA